MTFLLEGNCLGWIRWGGRWEPAPACLGMHRWERGARAVLGGERMDPAPSQQMPLEMALHVLC